MFKNFTKKNYSAHYSLVQFILSTGVVHASQKKKESNKGYDRDPVTGCSGLTSYQRYRNSNAEIISKY